MSTHQLYFHIVWTTRDRLPMIDEPTQRFLDEFFKKTAARHESQIIGLAILKTDVHMLVRTSARIDLPRLVQFFKGGSSYAASRQPGNILGLRWAKEYSATDELLGEARATPPRRRDPRLKPGLGRALSLRTVTAEHTLQGVN